MILLNMSNKMYLKFRCQNSHLKFAKNLKLLIIHSEENNYKNESSIINTNKVIS